MNTRRDNKGLISQLLGSDRQSMSKYCKNKTYRSYLPVGECGFQRCEIRIEALPTWFPQRMITTAIAIGSSPYNAILIVTMERLDPTADACMTPLGSTLMRLGPYSIG